MGLSLSDTQMKKTAETTEYVQQKSLTAEFGSIFCDESAVAMRAGARLAGAKFTFLPRSGSAGRTANSEYLLWARFFCHTNLHVQKAGHQLGGAHLDGLRPPDNGHGPILQKGTDKCAIYLQAAVIADEAFFLERIHKLAYSCARGTNHLRQGCLAHLQGVFRF